MVWGMQELQIELRGMELRTIHWEILERGMVDDASRNGMFFYWRSNDDEATNLCWMVMRFLEYSKGSIDK